MRGLWRAMAPFWGVVFVLGFLLGSALHPEWLREGAAALALVGMGIVLVWVWVRAERVLERHRQGWEGEVRTGGVLEGLPGPWRSFHGVVLPEGGEVDHVVVGESGVYAVESINWPGRISVEEGRLLDDGRGYGRYTLSALRERAEAVGAWLGVGRVVPVVSVAGGRLAPMPNPCEGVWFSELHTLAVVLAGLEEGGARMGAQERERALSRLESGPGNRGGVE